MKTRQPTRAHTRLHAPRRRRSVTAPPRTLGVVNAGFSLVELMTVVVIVGILSVIAIPTFMGYVYKSRTAEATGFLGVIKLREESFRSEFGQYCATARADAVACTTVVMPADGFGTAVNFVPSSSTVGKNPQVFTPTSQWLELGARPGGDVRFAYAVAAGDPANLPPNLGWNSTNADFWFVARAVGDLDGDTQYVTFETYSVGTTMWIGDSANNPLDKGWE